MRKKRLNPDDFSQTEAGRKVLKNMSQRLIVAKQSSQTVTSYCRAVEFLMNFQQEVPENIEIDEIIDFLYDLTEVKKLQWRTVKIYVAGLRWYYFHIARDEDMAGQIPYPKEEKSLPQIISREELTLIFNACSNPKHRVMFRLMYSSGLRRKELRNLKPEDIDTKDGKMRIRINKGKGNKDRYTVLSKNVLQELREYYITCHPKGYLFNGRYKNEPISNEGLRHALNAAVKKAGISKNVNMHMFRHCFATHSLEEGMNIKLLQYLMGHSSILTTMVYLHVSEMPLRGGFSPLDKWESNVQK